MELKPYWPRYRVNPWKGIAADYVEPLLAGRLRILAKAVSLTRNVDLGPETVRMIHEAKGQPMLVTEPFILVADR